MISFVTREGKSMLQCRAIEVAADGSGERQFRDFVWGRDDFINVAAEDGDESGAFAGWVFDAEECARGILRKRERQRREAIGVDSGEIDLGLRAALGGERERRGDQRK